MTPRPAPDQPTHGSVASGPWPPPAGPSVGWHEQSGRHRYFDGWRWSDEPRGDTRSPVPVLGIPAAVSAVAVMLASLVAAQIVVVLLEPLDLPLAFLVGLLVLVGYGPPAVWSVRLARRAAGPSGAAAAVLGWGWRWSDLGWGALVWLGAIVAQVVVVVALESAGVPMSSNTEGLDGSSPTGYLVATALAAVIAAPLVEELVFRGVLQRALIGRLGVVSAVTVQAVVFGAVHADPTFGSGNVGLVLVLTMVGAAFGVGAHLTGRLGTSIVAHAIFNSVVLAIVLSGSADGAALLIR
jgi:membrane protease YdiL (CAAX protease family)